MNSRAHLSISSWEMRSEHLLFSSTQMPSSHSMNLHRYFLCLCNTLQNISKFVITVFSLQTVVSSRVVISTTLHNIRKNFEMETKSTFVRNTKTPTSIFRMHPQYTYTHNTYIEKKVRKLRNGKARTFVQNTKNIRDLFSECTRSRKKVSSSNLNLHPKFGSFHRLG